MAFACCVFCMRVCQWLVDIGQKRERRDTPQLAVTGLPCALMLWPTPRPDPLPDHSTSNYSRPRLLDDPASSALDLDDPVHDDNDDNDSLSYLGPKMRFHSRAPWELDADVDDDADDATSIAHSVHSSLIGIFTSGRGKSSHKTGSSSSPRPSTGRPSVESSHSFLNSKRSFDGTHPRGAL